MTKEYSFQLKEMHTGRALYHSGKFLVVSNADVVAIQLYDKNDAALSQPVAISDGKVFFRTAESVAKVDVYGYTDDGFAFQIKGLAPGEISEFVIDTNRLIQHFIYPVNFSTSNTYGDVRVPHVSSANSTGMFLPHNAMIVPRHSGVFVTTLESGKSIDVGVIGSGSGITTDADGFFDGILFTTAGWKPAQIGYVIGSNSIYVDLTGGTGEWTSGALFHPASTRVAAAEGTDSTTTKNGFAQYADCQMINSGANTTELSYTFAGTPTAIKGFIVLTWRLPNVPVYP